LSSLNAEDFELIRPYLRTIDLAREVVLVEAGEALTRAYLDGLGKASCECYATSGRNTPSCCSLVACREVSSHQRTNRVA
jgi:hypothetical protein